MAKKKQAKRGSGRMKQLGYRLTAVWIHADEHKRIEAIAARHQMTMKAFVLAAVREAAFGLVRIED